MTLITRYAEGFLEYAKDNIGLKRALEELQEIKDLFRGNPEFKKFLENPAIDYAEKCGVIDKSLTGGISQEMRNFLKLLLKKGRIGRFMDIAEYARIKYSHMKRVKALLYTSYMMDLPIMKTFKDRLEKKLQERLQLYVNLDPDMLGGVRLVMGNKVLDGSVRKRLEDLSRKLLAANVG